MRRTNDLITLVSGLHASGTLVGDARGRSFHGVFVLVAIVVAMGLAGAL